MSSLDTVRFVYIASLHSSNKTAEVGANQKGDRTVVQDVRDSAPLLRAFLRTLDAPGFKSGSRRSRHCAITKCR